MQYLVPLVGRISCLCADSKPHLVATEAIGNQPIMGNGVIVIYFWLSELVNFLTLTP